jgi:hypothetical protein
MSDDNTEYTLDEGAIMIHEYYLSLQRAGFTQMESLELVKTLIKGSMG